MEGTAPYANIGLDPYLNAQTSLANSPNRVTTWEADSQYGVNPGGLDYSRIISRGREIKAVLALDKSGGAFDNLQAAINYADSVGGGKIFVAAGTYPITGTILMKSGISILGEDNDTTVFNFNDSGTNKVTCGTLSNIHFENITFSNTRQGTGNLNTGVLSFTGCNDFSVHLCNFNNFVGTDDGGQIFIGSSTNGVVQNSFFGTASEFVFCGTSENISFMNNQCSTGTTAGFVLAGGTSNTVFNNIIKNSVQPIFCSTQRSRIISNHIINGSTTGIVMSGAAGGNKDFIVTSNTIEMVGTADGITNGGTNCVIANNTLIALATGGNGIIGDNNNTIIASNRVRGFGWGVKISSNIDRCIIIGNQLTGNGTAITDGGTNGTTIGNITT